MPFIRLSELPAGVTARIESMACCAAAPRLRALGVEEGALVSRLFGSKKGPSAYYVGGSAVALRQKEAESVTVSFPEWA
ncbi:MAG: ferrous iron transport protein A [Clostridia bacterium]|nr:ferrous iron transport protein A [Clostridia bacterium]